MMNNDLISRSAAIEQVERREKILGGSSLISTRSFKNFLMNRPAVDAEPVVYCKDCIHRGNDVECPMCTIEFTWDEDDGSYYYWIDRTADDGFCHCGAKMRGDKDADE